MYSAKEEKQRWNLGNQIAEQVLGLGEFCRKERASTAESSVEQCHVFMMKSIYDKEFQDQYPVRLQFNQWSWNSKSYTFWQQIRITMKHIVTVENKICI